MTFEQERSRLLGVAYAITGSASDAEDLVQETWLKWTAVDVNEIDHPGPYLRRIITNLAIDRVRSAQVRRETYVGPWLPEPYVSDLDDDPADLVAEAEQLSLAFMMALERLQPVERAVFILRDVFDLDYAEIAGVVDRSEVACRQIASRSRGHVREPHRQHRVADERALLGAFAVALATGDLNALTGLLAQDVILWSDGGADRKAARHPIVGIERVSRFLLGIAKQGASMNGWVEPIRVNGDPGFKIMIEGELYGVMAFETTEEGVVGIRSVLAPDKLAHLTN